MNGERALSVGFIGAGQMGRPMVDRLVAAGRSPKVYARRAEVADDLGASGVDVATSATELAAAVDVLIVCVFSDAQLRELLLDGGVLAAMHPGAVLVSHTTGSPELVVELAERAPEGVGVVDMPVSGGAMDIAVGTLTVLAGGDPDDVARATEVVSAYSDPVIDVGGLGDAMRVKLVNNLLFTVQVRVALEGARVAETLGISSGDLARVLEHCSADSYALRRLAGGVDPQLLARGALPFLAKDMEVVRTVAGSMGLDLGVLGSLADWVDEPADR
jgi:3-hydroxyisobutyrate dehydrogenase-like beta-hydroxyacid dehydrogenase